MTHPEETTNPDAWEARFRRFLEKEEGFGDAAHDIEHIRRVVAQARRIGEAEGANLAVVLAAAWLHDCVSIPKSSPDRARASTYAAESAMNFLRESGYPETHIEAIGHAIRAHSFSAGIAPETLEARVVQDADRLDALGAVGIARTLMLGGAMGVPLYDPAEPIPRQRAADDRRYTLDHFYTKLFKLADTMQTAAGRDEAQRRTALMRRFVNDLAQEIPGTDSPIPKA